MKTLLAALAAVVAVVVAVLAASPWASGSARDPQSAPRVLGYATKVLGPVAFTPTPVEVASLPLPKGKYLVDAKLVVEAASGPADVTCELRGGAEDVARDDQLRSDEDAIETLALAAPASLGAPGSVRVVCRVNGGTAYASEVVVTAVKLTSLRATAVG